MKIFTNAMWVLLPIGLLAGCAPLEQAPLVYSSKQTLGIDLSTATTEQPGLALNLGFKSVDAAYVPVAVAKKCEAAAAGANCTHPIYEVRQIKGNHNLSDTSGSKEKLEDAQKTVAEFVSATNARKAADAALLQAHTQRVEAAKTVEATTQAVSNAEQKAKDAKAGAAAVQGGAAPTGAAEAAGAKAEAETTELAAKAAAAKSDLAKARENVVTKKGELDKAAAELEKIPLAKVADALKIVVTATNGKEDAYSVFGSFSANTAVGTNNTAPDGTKGATVAATAGVSLGKVFSTGVASQNLTLGIREYYAGVGMSSSQGGYIECMRSVKETYKRLGIPADESKIKSTEQAELLTAYKACQPREIPVAKQ